MWNLNSRVWEFVTGGPTDVNPVAADARETQEGVEVAFLDTGNRLVALEINDLAR